MTNYIRLNKLPLSILFILLPAIGLGVLSVLFRFFFGLSVTNMSDGHPWGIWIVFDVVIGTALGTGGYVMALLIYLLNKWQYHPMIRLSVMASMLGYSFAGISVIVDLGRWWNFLSILNPFNWNPGSVMLEVALCILGYTIITIIEFSPVLIEKAERKKAIFKFTAFFANKKALNYLLIFIFALGILLPTMHQSSLGTIMTIASVKVHPLWHSSFLPLLFFISALFMGYGVVVAESFAVSHLFRKENESRILFNISNIIFYIASLWLALRLLVPVFEGKAVYFISSGYYSILFALEIFLTISGIIIIKAFKPGIHLWSTFAGAVLLLLAGSLYRLNTYLLAFNPGDGSHYFPSLFEFFITLGIVSSELLVFLLCIRFLPLFPDKFKK